MREHSGHRARPLAVTAFGTDREPVCATLLRQCTPNEPQRLTQRVGTLSHALPLPLFSFSFYFSLKNVLCVINRNSYLVWLDCISEGHQIVRLLP